MCHKCGSAASLSPSNVTSVWRMKERYHIETTCSGGKQECVIPAPLWEPFLRAGRERSNTLFILRRGKLVVISTLTPSGRQWNDIRDVCDIRRQRVLPLEHNLQVPPSSLACCVTSQTLQACFVLPPAAFSYSSLGSCVMTSPPTLRRYLFFYLHITKHTKVDWCTDSCHWIYYVCASVSWFLVTILT